MPEDHAVDPDLVEVGKLTRREVDQVVVAYSFDLRTNELATTQVANPNAGREHSFKAYRVAGDPTDAVTLRARNQILAGLGAADAALDETESSGKARVPVDRINRWVVAAECCEIPA